jgi:Ser/Thr protein kinase RdoA (MazF antagonist)
MQEITDDARKMIADLWGLPRITLKVIKQSENHSCFVDTADKRYILRLTPQDHRSLEAIHAEIDYILLIALSHPYIHLCKPIPLTSKQEEHVGLITPYADNNNQWHAVMFEHAKGSDVIQQWRGLTDDHIIAAHGQLLAKMHQAIMQKGNNPKKWSKMEKDVPAWDQTHGGCSNIEKRVRPRAESGNKTCQMLIKLWEDKVFPFIRSCGTPNDTVFGVIHGDANLTNIFAEDTNSTELPTLWLFDFDQMHHNWFGFDLGVILHQLHYFEEHLFGQFDIEGFEANRFRKVFLDGYRQVAGDVPYLEPRQVEGFELFVEFCHTCLAVDVGFQVENGKQFEASITGICELLVKRFHKVYDDKIKL